MKLGIDIGSTTVKVVLMNENNEILYKRYERHMSSVLKLRNSWRISLRREGTRR